MSLTPPRRNGAGNLNGDARHANRIRHLLAEVKPQQQSSTAKAIASPSPLIDASPAYQQTLSECEVALANGVEFRAADIEIVDSKRTGGTWLRLVVAMRRRPGHGWELLNGPTIEVPIEQVSYISDKTLQVIDDPELLASLLWNMGDALPKEADDERRAA